MRTNPIAIVYYTLDNFNHGTLMGPKKVPLPTPLRPICQG